MRAKSAEDAFMTRGFQNRNPANKAFRQHELSACHEEDVERVITLPAATTDVDVAMMLRICSVTNDSAWYN